MAKDTPKGSVPRQGSGDRPSLREQQRESRRRRILAAAREHFVAYGFDAATMEGIAARAGVSAVTLYNYYGTKPGLLLALVTESDQLLMEKIEAFADDPPPGIVEAVAGYAAIIRAHALSYLTKPVWRQVIASSIAAAGSEFGEGYLQLDRALSLQLTSMLGRLRERGIAAPDHDLGAIGDCLFTLQNARFVQFVSVDGLTDERVDMMVRGDLEALLAFSG